MKVGPHVMTHGVKDREVVPRVGAGTSQASQKPGGNFKLIQCQLMLLLHARRCQQRQEYMLEMSNRENPTDSVTKSLLLNCPVRHCQDMKRTLDHLKTCSVGDSCTFQHCTSSLRILGHWTNCTIEECPLCQCVRQRMRRAKEFEKNLQRNQRYTFLAAALRSSTGGGAGGGAGTGTFLAAELAQEAGAGGFPECFPGGQELRSWPNATSNQNQPQNGQKAATIAENCKAMEDGKSGSIPSVEQVRIDDVRKAYEQLGIPCPEEALRRLMATLPNASQVRASHPQQRQIKKSESDTSDENENSMDTSNNADQGVFDCSSPAPSTSQESPQNLSRHSRYQQQQQQQQHPTISSTTSALKLPCKSSTLSRPK